ncbi:lytic polysaccharide monooxygenase [Bacillus thuringiensis]|uniref:lytic polysaccharide monooxygenase n=1 Tax=Bacillus cereus group TaxID=86661 RepID=UPI003A4E4B1B
MKNLKKKMRDFLVPAENIRNSRKRNKWRKIAPIAMCGIMGTMFFGGNSAFAHGYIAEGRAHIGSTYENLQLNWEQANNKYGAAVGNPQGVEAPKGFPVDGPIDGGIASGGHIEYAPLDIQKPFYWKTIDMNSGPNTFVWIYTASHKTTKWHYYITKQGWDSSKPLTRDELELIETVPWDGTNAIPNKPAGASGTGLPHSVNIPSDRSGYHVILGVWDVADTSNAFYQVMDVNIKSNNQGEISVDKEAPSTPINLKGNSTSSSIVLEWTASTDNVGVSYYNVYRNGEKLAPVTETEFKDVTVAPDTKYTYEVSAVDKSGNESAKTMPLTIKTEKASDEDTEIPTAPGDLHSMGETATTVDLMWVNSTDNVAVDHYEIYRNAKRLPTNVYDTKFMDTNLQPNTEYNYIVKAVDTSGNVSAASNLLKVKTKESSAEETTWNAEKVYDVGDHVLFNGNEYVAKWWTQGERPDTADVWNLISDIAVVWNAEKAYNSGDKVECQGEIYQAKWWTQGEIPGKSPVWEKQ